MSNLSRKSFLHRAAWAAAAFTGIGFTTLAGCNRRSPSTDQLAPGYGPLLPDPAGLLDLPAGFSYRIISRAGQPMSDGLLVPGRPDAMATFSARPGRVLLLRNHELERTSLTHWFSGADAFGDGRLIKKSGIAIDALYDIGLDADAPAPGGVTTLLYNPQNGEVEAQWLSLGGTLRNCAGGPTPWGTWISCEESVQPAGQSGYAKDHGYAFEVRATQSVRLQAARPLHAMGRFRREAVAVDPTSGLVYQTEDRPDGLLYRYVPDRPRDLAGGGRLQALVLRERSRADTCNYRANPDCNGVLASDGGSQIRVGQHLPVQWVDLDRPEAPDDDVRYRGYAGGAARFARGEGMWYGGGAVYFTATSGGPNRKGQIWRYRPAQNTLELFLEPNDIALMDMADNISFAPNGDLLICEDGYSLDNYLLGVTPAGRIYRLARNAGGISELAGAVFAPDGRTLFVNVQLDGLTLAIRGPFAARRGS